MHVWVVIHFTIVNEIRFTIFGKVLENFKIETNTKNIQTLPGPHLGGEGICVIYTIIVSTVILCLVLQNSLGTPKYS